MVYAEVTLHAANRDLHSGMYGGSALNPINALTRILGELHDAQGRIQLEGFYDGVRELSNWQRAQWDGLRFDEAAYLGDIGLSTPVGEQGRTPLERLWARPTADINGIWGGYTGPGSKTVIAAQASAKVSFRLVPGQDPASVFEAFQRFVTDRLPPDARAEFTQFASAPGIEVASDSAWVQAAQAALADEYGRPRRADRLRWLHPRGGKHAPAARPGLAAGRFRPVRRPGAQPERKVRLALLPRRPTQPRPPAGATGGRLTRHPTLQKPSPLGEGLGEGNPHECANETTLARPRD